MINRWSRRNTENFVVNSGIYTTLPEDINEEVEYCDWFYKLESYIHPQFQPITDTLQLYLLEVYMK